MSDWEQRRDEKIRWMEESCEFFGSRHQKTRERWVVAAFLTCLDRPFHLSEIISESWQNSIVDARFHDAAFQIKECVESGRKRSSECRSQITHLENVNSEEEYRQYIRSSGFTPKYLSRSEVVQIACDNLSEISNYGPRERSTTDLLIYFNHLVFDGKDGSIAPLSPTYGWRSISVTTSSWAAVLHTAETAPSWISAAKGRAHRSEKPLLELSDLLSERNTP